MNKGICFALGVAAGAVATYFVEEYRNQKRFEAYTKKLQDEFSSHDKKNEPEKEKTLVDLYREGNDEELMKRLDDIAAECEDCEEEEEEIEIQEVPEDLFEMQDYPDGFPGRLMSNLEATLIRNELEAEINTLQYGNPEERAAKRPWLIDPIIFGTHDAYTYVTLTYYADGKLADDMDELVDPNDWEDLIGTEALDAFGIEPQQENIVTVRNERLMCDIEIYKDARPYTDILKEKPYLMHQFQDVEDDE